MSDKTKLTDIKLTCKTCGKEFDYTVSEQLFFQEKGFGAPIRCHDCRKAKKANNEQNNSKPVETKAVIENDDRPDWVIAMDKDWHNRTVEINYKKSVN